VKGFVKTFVLGDFTNKTAQARVRRALGRGINAAMKASTDPYVGETQYKVSLIMTAIRATAGGDDDEETPLDMVKRLAGKDVDKVPAWVSELVTEDAAVKAKISE
jgi:hypothetical protein